ncbi:MAG TPA: MaoC family dehydratase [Candidatus Sulfotelmatobacter sp.]|nr:MaoC family dehydratase [Candidatus Sulfotelmatobacter sp.]
MLVVDKPQDMKKYVGKEIGVSDWVVVDQPTIDKFADATGDHQWIHVDVERARRELPTKETIAHGYLTLSLIPRLSQTIYKIAHRSRGVNYGLNKVRFTNMVPAGARVRLRQTIKQVDDMPDGSFRITSESVVEIEGRDRPACVAENIGIVYP